MPILEIMILLAGIASLIGAMFLLIDHDYDPVKPKLSSHDLWRQIILLLQAWKYIIILFWRPVFGAILLIVSIWIFLRVSFQNIVVGGLAGDNIILAAFLLSMLCFISGYHLGKGLNKPNAGAHAPKQKGGFEK